MATVYLDPEPDDCLARLHADPGRARFASRVEDVLDELERDPRGPRVRRHRFQIPALWCITLWNARSSGRSYVWEDAADEADAVVVRYIGPASFP